MEDILSPQTARNLVTHERKDNFCEGHHTNAEILVEVLNRNSPSCAEGVYPRNYTVDRQQIQISDLHFYTFPTSSTFSCWKVRFKFEVCARS